MDQLVVTMPGYIGHTSFRDERIRERRHDLVLSARWPSSWRGSSVPEHLEAQALGRAAFYREYEIEVAEIVRHYEWNGVRLTVLRCGLDPMAYDIMSLVSEPASDVQICAQCGFSWAATHPRRMSPRG